MRIAYTFAELNAMNDTLREVINTFTVPAKLRDLLRQNSPGELIEMVRKNNNFLTIDQVMLTINEADRELYVEVDEGDFIKAQETFQELLPLIGYIYNVLEPLVFGIIGSFKTLANLKPLIKPIVLQMEAIVLKNFPKSPTPTAPEEQKQ